jgi:hypothetical protein
MITDRISLITFRASLRVSGEDITFVRGDVTIPCKAIRGNTNWDANTAFPGNRVGNRSTDWLIVAADLIPTDETDPLTPKRDDAIQTDAGDFKVMPFGADSQLWKYHDRARQIYRIFTKERT